MAKVSLYVRPELHHRVKAAANEARIPIMRWLEIVLTKELDRHERRTSHAMGR